ncbi:hypothetical protein Q3G72_024625 [Acer saccharum]|nr:hypothetical protein Q3G72_024625 [Acer saccharum]
MVPEKEKGSSKRARFQELLSKRKSHMIQIIRVEDKGIWAVKDGGVGISDKVLAQGPKKNVGGPHSVSLMLNGSLSAQAHHKVLESDPIPSQVEASCVTHNDFVQESRDFRSSTKNQT